MMPFDLRVMIQKALDGVSGVEQTGCGSFMVPPYTADISVTAVGQRFTIKIDRDDLVEAARS